MTTTEPTQTIESLKEDFDSCEYDLARLVTLVEDNMNYISEYCREYFVRIIDEIRLNGRDGWVEKALKNNKG